LIRPASVDLAAIHEPHANQLAKHLPINLPMNPVPIDLRSDTVTRPSRAMRAAMMAAGVGDDQYGDDPAANALQERLAALAGKEAALWFLSGTQANQAALLALTKPGDEVIVCGEAHSLWHETGGSAKNAGVQITPIGMGGVCTAADLDAAVKPRGHHVFPPTTLLQIENTHNRGGGVIFPQAQVEAVCAAARRHGLATYLDGARLWNVAAATGLPLATLAAPFDLVMLSLSKGLGAPGGSMLAGPKPLIAEAVRYRRMLGGAGRQIGFYCAAAQFALDHNRERLADDHANARALAQRIAQCPGVKLDLDTVQTNIVVFHLTDAAPPTAEIVARARKAGVLVSVFGPRILRAVTHLDVSADQCRAAGDILAGIIGGR
jgi:threonine aldolase